MKVEGELVQNWFEDEHGINITVQQSRALIRHVLGVRYGEHDPPEKAYQDRREERKAWATEMSHLRKKEREGEIIIVRWDQSYINRGTVV